MALLRTSDERAVPVAGFATGTPSPGASILVVAAGPDGPVLAAGIVSSVGPEWRSLRGGRIDARVELDVRLPRIAERLGISVHTAKFHVGSIIEKLDSSGRTDAVAHALRAGVPAP